MPCVTAHPVMSCVQYVAHTGKPATLCICGVPEITYGHAIHAS